MEEIKLTKKQEIFVEKYLETGVGAVAAREAFDIQSKEPSTASAMANEYLKKPNIIEAIRQGMKDNQIEEAFDKLVNAKRLDYFVFPKSMSDEEITTHVEAQGITVLNVRQTEKGKMAFFAIPDANALSKAIEIWAKVGGAYAPSKSIIAHVKTEPSDRIKELARKMNYGK